MKVVIDISTTEELDLTTRSAHEQIHELIAKVVQADRVCREMHGPHYAGRTHGNWIYSWDEAQQHALTYSMEIAN